METSILMGSESGEASPVTCVDEAFVSGDGTLLKARFWTTARPRATLVIAHGLGEHGGSYRRLAEALCSHLSIDVFGVDLRGSGRSSGRRGVVGDYLELANDLNAAVGWVERERPGLPRFLLGHSNGGLVSIRMILEYKPELRGLILSNPSLRLLAHVPIWKRVVAQLLMRVAPWFTLQTGLSNDQLTHDPEIMAEIEADPLRHNRISSPLYFGMIGNGAQVQSRAQEIGIPTLVILGGADPIIDPRAGRDFFENLGSTDKTLKVYPEMRHEPLSEVGRAQVVADLEEWLESRITASQ